MQPTADALVQTQQVSFEEFLELLNDENHAEWVNGEVIAKSFPNVNHQQVCTGLLFLVSTWVWYHELGKVFHPPLQVFLELPDGTQVSREPDIVVVLNDRKSRLKEFYCDGAPNLIVEVVSPPRKIDRTEKFLEYEAAGVPEYWIIDPEREYAEFWQLDEAGAYRAAFTGSEGVYHSRELPGFWLRVEWIWQSPPIQEILRAWGIA